MPRVITGSAKGMKLETLAGEATRPTADRVKQALFSMIQFDIEGRQAIDLFAGSGQLGIEALSRGAVGCVFLDSSREAVEVVRRNLQKTRLFPLASLICREAEDYLRHTSDRFDLCFLDPPYGGGLLPRVLPLVAGRMNPGGIVVCETGRETELPETAETLTLTKSVSHGAAVLWVYRR